MRIALLGPIRRNAPIAAFLEKRGHSVLASNDEMDLPSLRAEMVEFIVSGGYGPIFREPILGAYPERIINLHNSYLPWGRGIFPILWSILEGAPVGITIHRIVADIDGGPVLARREVAPFADDTMRSLHDRLQDELVGLFVENCDDILAGRMAAVSQDGLGPAQPYRSRLDSERIADLLPQGWDTPVASVAGIGRDLAEARSFWSAWGKAV